MNYYGKSIPTINDKVVVEIKNIGENGVYCLLKEYNNIEGFILPTEIYSSRHDKKNIFKIGELYPTLVINVNEEKQTIDLSYRKLKPDDRKQVMENYFFGEKLFKLSQDAVSFLNPFNLAPEIIMKNTLWNLFRFESHRNNIKSVYQKVLQKPTLFVNQQIEDIYKNHFDNFVSNLENRIIKTEIVLSKQFELTIYNVSGVNTLKDILKYDDSLNNKNAKYEIKYISSPKYEIQITGNNYEDCLSLLNEISNIIKEKASKYECLIQMPDGYNIIKQQQFILQAL